MRILIADDHPAVRQGISVVLKDVPDIEIVGEAADGEEALAKVAQLHPDLVILDITMPHLDGLAAAEIIKQAHPHTKVLILSMHGVGSVVRAAKNIGVDGYVAKHEAGSTLLIALDEIRAGRTYFPDVLSETAVQRNGYGVP